MKGFVKHSILLLLAACALDVVAQVPKASIDRTTIRIGEQAVIELSCELSTKSSTIKFPEVGEKLLEGIEVVTKSEIDTLLGASRLSQKLYITGFDSGYYAIPPFVFNINGSPAQTEAFLLTVETVALDSIAAPRPEQGIYQVEVSILDYITAYQNYIYIGLGCLLALALIAFFLRRWKRNEVLEEPEPEPEIVQPAHLSALLALEQLKKEKLYLGGKLKEFHTRLTDIIREYLEKRFGVQAHELTSRQIMQQLTYLGIPEIDQNKLRTLLFMADMVKFAKAQPDAIENEQSLDSAIQFVQHTANTDLISEKSNDV